MKNSEHWKPSKFIYVDGKLRSTREEKELSLSSRFAADLVAKHFDEHLRHHVRGRLIDLGCGKVPLYGSYKEYVTECICADWQNTIHTNPFLDIQCDLNQPLPFDNSQFDTIILSDVLEHISQPNSLWSEMHRILRPGGKIILNVPFFYKLHEIPHDYFRYTKYALLNFANASGFKVVLLTEIGGLPEILTDLLGKSVAHATVIGKAFSRLIQFMGKFFIGSKLSKKTQEHFPLGYFMIVEKLS